MRQLAIRLVCHVMQWVLGKSLLETCEGIKLCDPTSKDGAQSEAFRVRILEALTLIKMHDPRRFRRLQRRLDYIVNSRCLGGGEYNHNLRVCEVDFARFRFQEAEEEWRLALARTLIHEATHGVVTAWGILYDREHYLRIERLCHREEIRFARRVRPNAETQEFDETWWRNNFEAGRWRSTASYIRRLREADLPTA